MVDTDIWVFSLKEQEVSETKLCAGAVSILHVIFFLTDPFNQSLDFCGGGDCHFIAEPALIPESDNHTEGSSASAEGQGSSVGHLDNCHLYESKSCELRRVLQFEMVL